MIFLNFFNGQLTIPLTVEKIGNSAFRNCCGLTGSLVLPTNVNFTYIEFRAFYNCSSFHRKRRLN